jgi:hypothetical protein
MFATANREFPQDLFTDWRNPVGVFGGGYEFADGVLFIR